MAIVKIARAQLSNPMGDMGDRNIITGSTLVLNNEWHIEADIHQGSLRDVHVYRNTSVNNRDAEPTWEWYAAVPAANIKAYRIADYNPAPQTLNAEPQAAPAQKAATASGAKPTAG